VADGAIDSAAFAQRSLARRAPPGAGPGAGSGSGTWDGGGGGGAAAAPAAAPPARRERFVMLRGVQWAAPDLDTARMWRSLVRVWPRPLAAGRRGGGIVAHDGVAEMAAVRGGWGGAGRGGAGRGGAGRGGAGRGGAGRGGAGRGGACV
jgi:hypothetical protein